MKKPTSGWPPNSISPPNTINNRSTRPDHGFEFSIADIEAFLSGVRAANIAALTMKDTMKKDIAQAA